MERIGEHPVPVGPLAVRWLELELPAFRAGTSATLRVRLRNDGSARWRQTVKLSYHWLDDRGNPIVWDGWRTDFPRQLGPGEHMLLSSTVRAPMPPGAYRLALDLIEESRFWFAEFGSFVLERPVEVAPRIERRLGVRIHGNGDATITNLALAAQEEPLVEEGAGAIAHLVAGSEPEPDWSRRILDAHAEGFAAVGPAIESSAPELGPWSPTDGRNPGFRFPLLLPSLVVGIDASEHQGLPAWQPDPHLNSYDEEPWIFDGRIRLRLPRGRPRG
jgi:hypothetical protein